MRVGDAAGMHPPFADCPSAAQWKPRKVSSSASSFFTSSRADKMGNTSADGHMPPPRRCSGLESPSRREPRERSPLRFYQRVSEHASGAASSHRRCRATAGTPALAVGKPDFIERCSHSRTRRRQSVCDCVVVVTRSLPVLGLVLLPCMCTYLWRISCPSHRDVGRVRVYSRRPAGAAQEKSCGYTQSAGTSSI